jgi:hypothetical protein
MSTKGEELPGSLASGPSYHCSLLLSGILNGTADANNL